MMSDGKTRGKGENCHGGGNTEIEYSFYTLKGFRGQ